MAKTLTILIPSMKVHISMRQVFPKLKTEVKEFVVGTKEQKVLPHIDLTNRVLIRWGSPYETADIPGVVAYNSRQSSRRAANKRLSRQTLSDAGVSVPRVVTPNSEGIRYPLIARPRFHSLGKNFVLIKDIKEFEEHYGEHAPLNWYYSEYVDKVQEFRVHVGHGKILCILEKGKGNSEFNWNSNQSKVPPVFLEPRHWSLPVVRESIQAVKAMGMDFSGVDVIVDQEGKAYIVELNTTPRMSTDVRIQEQYAHYFDWLAASDTRRPHFEIESDNPADYAWKHRPNKTLTILVPTMKIHSSMALVFPKLETEDKEFVVGTKEQKVLPHIDLTNRVLIRWGSLYRTVKIAGSITYNSRQSVRRANNKRLSRQLLSDAGILVPRMVTPGSGDIRYPLITRPRGHRLGKNLIVLHHRDEFMSHYGQYAPQGWYYSEYVDKVQEFRVNVAHGKILSILEIPKGEHRFSWNRTQTNILPVLIDPSQWNLAVIRESIRAVKTIGIDFAGVDVMVDREGKAYVLELNTTPGMSSTVYTQEQYARYFDWLAASDKRRPHFEVESDNPADYAWGEDGENKEERLRVNLHSA